MRGNENTNIMKNNWEFIQEETEEKKKTEKEVILTTLKNNYELIDNLAGANPWCDEVTDAINDTVNETVYAIRKLEEEKTEEGRLVERIDEAMRGYHHPYVEEIDYYYKLKEKLEGYYEEVTKSNLVGKDLIADYISEKIMEIDRRIE